MPQRYMGRQGDTWDLRCGLLLFASASSMPVLCWYWLRHIGGRRFEVLPLCLALAALLLIGIVNVCLISPFLAVIITF